MKAHIYRVLILLPFVSSNAGFSQLDPRFSQNIFIPTFYNPATAGFNESTKITSANRTQWLNNQTHFTTNYVDGQWRKKDETMGFLVGFSNDHQGIANNTSLRLGANYRVQMFSGLTSFGISTGAMKLSKSYSDLLINDPNDVVINNSSNIAPDVSFGTFYQGKKIQLGLSIRHLNQPKLYKGFNNNHRFRRNYYIHGTYLFQINKLDLYHFAILRYAVGITPQIDFGTTVELPNYLNAGVLLRSNKEFAIMVGYSLGKNHTEQPSLRINYAFETGLISRLRSLSTTHELIMSFDIAGRPNPESILKKRTKISPLFF